MKDQKIPVTLFTGYLGAGKTTIITNLIKSVPDNYKIAWLKNEVGNTAVDSELAEQQNVATIKEILKGCLCHYMIGSLNSALDEMLESDPDHIFIETSGSAAPAPIVWEIRKNPRLTVNGVVTVIDAINFKGYVDKSPTLKMQAKYTDLILINKHEELDERTLDTNLDDLYEINLDTPKIKADKGHVSPDIIFGLDSTLFLTQQSVMNEEEGVENDHQALEVDLIEIQPDHIFDINEIESQLENFQKKKFYRIKGVIKTKSGNAVLNNSFGTTEFTLLDKKEIEPRIVFMGEDIKEDIHLITETFHVSKESIHFTPKGHHHKGENNHKHEDPLH